MLPFFGLVGEENEGSVGKGRGDEGALERWSAQMVCEGMLNVEKGKGSYLRRRGRRRPFAGRSRSWCWFWFATEVGSGQKSCDQTD